jgi:Domain of unknown function (DUF1906)
MANVYGMDTSTYPGNSTMDWFKSNCGFRYTGFYLAPAPQHPNTGWMNRRAYLATQGWGFIPTYVGLQIGNGGLSTARGRADALSAVSLMADAGFAKPDLCYLDLEEGTAPSGNYASYIEAWLDKVNSEGYTAALYASRIFNTWSLARTPYLWTWRVPSTPSGTSYPPNDIPTGSLVAGSLATQYRHNVSVVGKPTLLDFNVSKIADPSNKAAADHALGL